MVRAVKSDEEVYGSVDDIVTRFADPCISERHTEWVSKGTNRMKRMTFNLFLFLILVAFLIVEICFSEKFKLRDRIEYMAAWITIASAIGGAFLGNGFLSRKEKRPILKRIINDCVDATSRISQDLATVSTENDKDKRYEILNGAVIGIIKKMNDLHKFCSQKAIDKVVPDSNVLEGIKNVQNYLQQNSKAANKSTIHQLRRKLLQYPNKTQVPNQIRSELNGAYNDYENYYVPKLEIARAILDMLCQDVTIQLDLISLK